MANLEVIALDTATPQLKAPQAGDGYAMPRPVTVTEVVGSTALTLTGATQTTAVPVLNATQTWNNAATTFTTAKINVTDTASNAASLLLDLQVGGSSKFKVDKIGTATFGTAGSSSIFNIIGTTNLSISASNSIQFPKSSGSNGFTFDHGASRFSLYSGYIIGFATANNAPDVFIGRKAAANFALGGGDAASLIAQTLSVGNIVAGTSNTAGANFTIAGSQGTGTGVGGDIIFQVASAGSTGTAQNALATAMRVYNTKTVAVGSAFTVATLPAAGTQGRRAWVTDATAPTFLGALTGGGAVVCPVFDNGTAWISG